MKNVAIHNDEFLHSSQDTEPPRQAEQVAGGNAALWAWGKVWALDYFQRSRQSPSRVPQLGVRPKATKAMRSEFQFLQSESDEDAFVDAFIREVDSLEKESLTQWFFRIGDCQIQFLRSRRDKGQISLGRIALATHGFGLAPTSAPKAEALFKKMRTWLKKSYTNQLTAENVSKPASVTSYRMMWLGPDARMLYRSGEIELRTIWGGPVIINEEKIAL